MNIDAIIAECGAKVDSLRLTRAGAIDVWTAMAAALRAQAKRVAELEAELAHVTELLIEAEGDRDHHDRERCRVVLEELEPAQQEIARLRAARPATVPPEVTVRRSPGDSVWNVYMGAYCVTCEVDREDADEVAENLRRALSALWPKAPTATVEERAVLEAAKAWRDVPSYNSTAYDPQSATAADDALERAVDALRAAEKMVVSQTAANTGTTLAGGVGAVTAGTTPVEARRIDERSAGRPEPRVSADSSAEALGEVCRTCGGKGVLHMLKGRPHPSGEDILVWTEDEPCPDCRPAPSPEPVAPAGEVVRWRVGRKLGRTLYFDEVCVGMVDRPEMAEAIVAAMNGFDVAEAEARGRKAGLAEAANEADRHSNMLGKRTDQGCVVGITARRIRALAARGEGAK